MYDNVEKYTNIKNFIVYTVDITQPGINRVNNKQLICPCYPYLPLNTQILYILVSVSSPYILISMYILCIIQYLLCLQIALFRFHLRYYSKQKNKLNKYHIQCTYAHVADMIKKNNLSIFYSNINFINQIQLLIISNFLPY